MYAKCVKRALDFLLAAGVLILFSPLLLILTILISIKMKGNPFFTQTRPGLREKPFKLIKFRSMTNERDESGKLLPDEVRLTKFGKLLRATSLDELPEFINILKGDMSLVGPRPLLMDYLPLYNETQRHRHDVRPGLTGLAQINGRNDTTWEERFEWDILYVKRISFREDFRIVMKTVGAVIRRDGISGKDSATMSRFEGSNADNNRQSG